MFTVPSVGPLYYVVFGTAFLVLCIPTTYFFVKLRRERKRRRS